MKIFLYIFAFIILLISPFFGEITLKLDDIFDDPDFGKKELTAQNFNIEKKIVQPIDDTGQKIPVQPGPQAPAHHRLSGADQPAAAPRHPLHHPYGAGRSNARRNLDLEKWLLP